MRYSQSLGDVSEASSASFFCQKTPNLVGPLHRAILSHWVRQKHSACYDMRLTTDRVHG
jgi:hypothetical protein